VFEGEKKKTPRRKKAEKTMSPREAEKKKQSKDGPLYGGETGIPGGTSRSGPGGKSHPKKRALTAYQGEKKKGFNASKPEGVRSLWERKSRDREAKRESGRENEITHTYKYIIRGDAVLSLYFGRNFWQWQKGPKG